MTWNDEAATFDDEPDHGLGTPAVRAAWANLLLPLLPTVPAEIVDLGCGTGSLAVLLAAAGHVVRGLDSAPAMLAVARDKAVRAGVSIDFREGDAADPPYGKATVDVALVRHVLWAMPDPDAALARWVALLKPGGRLLLVEGRWHTGAGLAATTCRDLVLRHRNEAAVTLLTDPALWGGEIADERYLVVSRS